MNESEIDRRLQDLLAPPEEFPDASFAARIRRTILIEDQLAAARRRVWRRFGVEALGTFSVLLALLILGPSGSALAAIVMTGLWMLIGLGGSGSRPSARSRDELAA